MTRTQCAALMPNGRRCRHAAAPSSLFCVAHAAFAESETEGASALDGGGGEVCSGVALRQWLSGVLQAEIMALCAADLAPLDRVDALVNLGELFLQALPAGDDLDVRVADLEVRAAELERCLNRS